MISSRCGTLNTLLSILLISAIFLPVCTAAIDTTVIGESLPATQEEGTFVNFSLVADGFPVQTASVVLETDLVPAGDAAVWKISESDQLNTTLPEEDLRSQKIQLDVEGTLNRPFTIVVSGAVPVITETKQVDGLVITKRDPRRSGYTYYRIQAMDANGFKVGNAVTETFTIVVPEEAAFMDRLGQVSDTRLRGIIADLYEKGLVNEAEDLLSYAERPVPASVPLWLAGGGFLLAVVIGFVAGQRRGINIERKNRDIRGD